MTLPRHLILFAKAPLMGQVKRRLSADIGPARAVMVYHHLAAGLIRDLSRASGWQSWLAVSPDGLVAEATRIWPGVAAGTKIIGQGTGDLGTRMDRALRRPPPGPAVLVGTDIPAMSRRHIDRAFDLLGSKDVVLGPAEDGGFWLVGLKRRPTVRFIFDNVRWSSADALADVRRNVEAMGLTLGVAARLADLDDGRAYHSLLVKPD